MKKKEEKERRQGIEKSRRQWEKRKTKEEEG